MAFRPDATRVDLRHRHPSALSKLSQPSRFRRVPQLSPAIGPVSYQLNVDVRTLFPEFGGRVLGTSLSPELVCDREPSRGFRSLVVCGHWTLRCTLHRLKVTWPAAVQFKGFGTVVVSRDPTCT